MTCTDPCRMPPVARIADSAARHRPRRRAEQGRVFCRALTGADHVSWGLVPSVVCCQPGVVPGSASNALSGAGSRASNTWPEHTPAGRSLRVCADVVEAATEASFRLHDRQTLLVS